MIKLGGTLTFTEGSLNVTGTDTSFLSSVFTGDSISRDRDHWYSVLTVASDTALTIEPTYAEGTPAQVFSNQTGWVLQVSPLRQNTAGASAQVTDFLQRYRELLTTTGADRRLVLNKVASTDFSEIIHQAGGVNKFRTGLIADNEWALQAFINNAWANVLKTITAGVNPSQTVTLSYALGLSIAVGTVALPGYAFVGRLDTGMWSPAAATVAWSAGGVEAARATTTLWTDKLNVTIEKASPTFTMNAAAAGQARLIRGQTNALLRWQADFGDTTAEAGANAGSDFYLRSYNDAGSSIGDALKITRSSMLATFGAGIVVTSGAINAVGAGTITLGGVSTGNITTPRIMAVTNATASTSTITGALTVAGGAGIGGAGWFGGDLTVQKSSATVTVNATIGNPTFKLSENGTKRWDILVNVGGSKQLFIMDEEGDTGVGLDQDATSWGVASDMRLLAKQNARTVSGLLSRLDDFRLVEYGKNHSKLGVIAQEFHRVAPHLVKVGDREDRAVKGLRDPGCWSVTPAESGFVGIQIGKEIWASLDPRTTTNENDIAAIKRHLKLAA